MASNICPACGRGYEQDPGRRTQRCKPCVRDGRTTSRPTSWATSSRRDQLPPNWGSLRKRILARDPECQIRGDRCTGRSTQVDHINGNLDHSDGNLRGVCAPCHASRTSRQRLDAKAAKRAKRYRPQEKHPGSI